MIMLPEKKLGVVLPTILLSNDFIHKMLYIKLVKKPITTHKL